MAGGLRSHTGGITSLQLEILNVPARYAALQYDLLVRGRSLDDLGSEALTWYDLLVLVKYLQQDTAARLSQELHGPSWAINTQLLAMIADALHIANWQRAGRRTAPKPKPIKRPWDKAKSTALGKGAVPISKFNDWWNSARPKTPRRKNRRMTKPLTSR